MLFVFAAAFLTLIALAVLLLPLLRAPKVSTAVDRRQANLDIFRDQLQELERNRDEGLLTPEDFVQAKSELQRRLLEEVDVPSAQDSTVTKHSSRRSALVLAIFIPLAAVFGYVQLGNLKGLEAKPNQAHMQAQELDAMLARLVERLKANPGDTKGWVMLARSYKSLGRFAEAAEAFSHGGALVEGDAALLADYAETLAQANGGDFTDKADALLARALKLDPSEPQALFLAGASASDRRDFVAAIDYWGRLLPQLEAGSEEASSLSAAIDKAREILGPAGAANNKATKKKDVASDAAQAISGAVGLSGKLASKAQPEDTLYVFARPAEGSRMPLAVLRARVADLPLKFSLDDRSSLPGGQKLSAARDVVLEARVTKGGIAQSISGDLFGTLKGIKPGSKNQRLIIDQVQP